MVRLGMLTMVDRFTMAYVIGRLTMVISTMAIFCGMVDALTVGVPLANDSV